MTEEKEHLVLPIAVQLLDEQYSTEPVSNKQRNAIDRKIKRCSKYKTAAKHYQINAVVANAMAARSASRFKMLQQFDLGAKRL